MKSILGNTLLASLLVAGLSLPVYAQGVNAPNNPSPSASHAGQMASPKASASPRTNKAGKHRGHRHNRGNKSTKATKSTKAPAAKASASPATKAK